jgi:hypothetical protein
VVRNLVLFISCGLVGWTLAEGAAALLGSTRGEVSAATVDPVIAKARQDFTQLFQRAKEQAAPGCQAVGGRLWVGVDQKSGAVTVSCEIR